MQNRTLFTWKSLSSTPVGMRIQHPTQEIDLHRIILRYLHTRVQNETVLRKLRRSIDQYGQITPVLVVPEETGVFILIDGYMRVLAIKTCKMDMVNVQICESGEKDALVLMLRKDSERRAEPIEQALMISELIERFGMSLSEVGKEMARDKSWVKRRLDLIVHLPEEALEAVQTGKISVWSASRVLAPLARANSDHARQLTRHLQKHPMPTRQLAGLYEHYKKSNRNVRKRIIDDPCLFCRVEESKRMDAQAQNVKNGPEGLWIKDMGIVYNILVRLCNRLETVFYQGQPEPDHNELMHAFRKAKTQFELMERRIRGHERPTNPPDSQTIE